MFNFLEKFNSKYHVFGSLCVRNHNHKNNQSIRYKSNNKYEGKCIQCDYELKKKQEKRKELQKKWRENNKERNKENLEKWTKNNKERIQQKNKEYYYKNRDKLLIYQKEYDNKEENKIKKKEYRQKPEIKIQKNLLTKKRRNENLDVKLSLNISNSIRLSLKRNKNKWHWETLVNFNLNQLKDHLQIQTLNKNFEIDHIIPLSWFKFNSYLDEEFKLVWNLKNLQLLLKTENRRKLHYYSGSPTKQILDLKEFKELKELFPIKLICNVIWNEYYKKA